MALSIVASASRITGVACTAATHTVSNPATLPMVTSHCLLAAASRGLSAIASGGDDDGQCGWDGGLGTAWSNLPSEDLVVVVLTQRAADHTGMPAICADVLTAALNPNDAR